MDKDGFIHYLAKVKKKKENTFPYYLRKLAVLENYLNENTDHKDLDKITAEELRNFISKTKDSFKSSLDLLPIQWYYDFIKNEEIYYLIIQYAAEISLETYKLSQFMDVDKEIISQLKKNGIITAQNILDKGATKEGRKAIVEQTGIQAEKILELVKLANIARVPGHKAKRARLYVDAGIDTLDKMAKLTAEDLVRISKEYIEKNGFDGSPPILSDANFSVENARRIPRIVEFWFIVFIKNYY